MAWIKDYNEDKLTTLEQNEIEEVANLCPLLYGTSVHSARAIASNWTDQRFDNIACEEVYVRSDNRTSNGEIFLYPNPTTGIVNLANVPQNGVVEVYNAVGSKVMTGAISVDGNLDISQLMDGVYFIKVVAGDFIQTKQVIKIQ